MPCTSTYNGYRKEPQPASLGHSTTTLWGILGAQYHLFYPMESRRSSLCPTPQLQGVSCPSQFPISPSSTGRSALEPEILPLTCSASSSLSAARGSSAIPEDASNWYCVPSETYIPFFAAGLAFSALRQAAYFLRPSSATTPATKNGMLKSTILSSALSGTQKYIDNE